MYTLGVFRLQKFWKKLFNRETVLYLVFGILTTGINIGICGFLADILQWNVYLANSIAWVLSVAFAFVTNKLFVFHSRSVNKHILLKETVFFLLARLASLGVDMLIVWLLATLCGMNLWVVKIISNVVVIVLNYILSKLFIFNHKQNTKQQ